MEVTYPPPPRIMVPLHPNEGTRGMLNLPPGDPEDPRRSREFELGEECRGRGPDWLAVYTEVYRG